MVPSASCTSFTKRSDEESGCGHLSRNSSEGSSEGGRSYTPLIGDQLAEDGSATQPEEEEGKYAVVVASSSGNRFPHSVDPTAVECAFCTSFTERSDEESGYWAQNGGSSHGSSRSDTLLIGDQLAEDGSATQAEEKEGKYAVVVPLKSGNRFPPCVDTTAVVYSELNIRATHVS